MTGGHGAVVVGSAISGGVKNVYFHDCKISGTMQGIRIKSMRGRGGYVDNVKFHNIEINDVEDEAIQIKKGRGDGSIVILEGTRGRFYRHTLGTRGREDSGTEILSRQ